jgi:phosphate transport system protein
MERHRDQDLFQIRQHLLEMGGIVEGMIGDSMLSLTARDTELAQRTIEQDREVDRREKKIDEDCLSILATQQPTAVDLRFLIVVMKIVNDLERMGDSAKNIAQSAVVLNEEAPLKPYIDLPHMARLAREMVHDSLDAFVQRNTELAREVWHRDDEIDALYHQLFRELLTYMIEDPRKSGRALHLLLIALYLERIADHATNICEDVIYFVEGVDIRHAATRYGETEPAAETN